MPLTPRELQIVTAVSRNSASAVRAVFGSNKSDIDQSIYHMGEHATPLAAAAFMGWNESLKALLAEGANPNIQNTTFGSTALVIAAAKSNIGAMSILLGDSRTNPNIKNNAGETALAFSIIGADRDSMQQNIISELLRKGAHPEVVLDDPRTSAPTKDTLRMIIEKNKGSEPKKLEEVSSAKQLGAKGAAAAYYKS